jgi:hypothetical protein
LLAGAQSGHEWSQGVVGDTEPFAVALFEEDPLAYGRGDPVEVVGVQRQTELVLLAGGGEYSEAHKAHVGRLISVRTRCAPALPFPEGDAEMDDGVRGALGNATVLRYRLLSGRRSFELEGSTGQARWRSERAVGGLVLWLAPRFEVVARPDRW